MAKRLLTASLAMLVTALAPVSARCPIDLENATTIGPEYPKTPAQMIERTNEFRVTRGDGAGPNPSRWTVFKREAERGTLDGYRYTSVRDHGLPLIRAAVEGILTSQKLDAIVYPTASRRQGPSLTSARERRQRPTRFCAPWVLPGPTNTP